MKSTYMLLSLILVGIVASAGAYAFMGKGPVEYKDYDDYIASFDDNDRPFMLHKLSLEEFEERQARHQEREAHREIVDAAIESGNFNAWVEAVSDSPRGDVMVEVITEDNFDQLTLMHELRESGDLDGAHDIAESLGLEPFDGHGRGRGMGRQGCMN